MSFPQYSEYKDSGVEWLGKVPAHWDVVKFRYCFGESLEKIEKEVVGPMLSVSGYRGIEVKEYDDENRRRSDEELIGYRIVRPGQLVVNTMWLNYAGLGVSEYEGHVSPAYRSYWIRSDLHRRFVHHLMRCEAYVKGYTKYLTGIRPNSLQMSRDDLMVFPVLIPPAVEQENLARFIDVKAAEIDALIYENEKLIAILKEKRQAIISDTVTKGLDPSVPMKDSGVEWMGNIPDHWEAFHFRRVISAIEQGWSPNADSAPCEGPGWGVIKLGAIKKGKFFASENKALFDDEEVDASIEINDGDLLLTRANTVPLVGDSCVVKGLDGRRLILSDLVYRIALRDQQCRKYFSYFLISSYGRVQVEMDARGSSMTMAKISQGHIASWVVCIPPLKEQIEISNYLDGAVDRIDRLLCEAESAIGLLNERRSSLISSAVTGEIDVRRVVIS